MNQPDIEEGKIYKVRIEHLLPGNRGLAKIESFPIYVNNVNKKEEIKIKITKLAKTYAQAEKI
ncbi:MAG: TRAM domain-containing protein [Candidatus Micrarchaeota archaeon]|nr:TRAM domain-containing protein [Candidatus Micrarchaeota archaeon]